MYLCYRCHQYKDAALHPSYNDPLAQVCDECKMMKGDEGNLTLEKEWDVLVEKLYAERRKLKGRVDEIDVILRGFESQGVLRMNRGKMGEESNG